MLWLKVEVQHIPSCCSRDWAEHHRVQPDRHFLRCVWVCASVLSSLHHNCTVCTAEGSIDLNTSKKARFNFSPTTPNSTDLGASWPKLYLHIHIHIHIHIYITVLKIIKVHWCVQDGDKSKLHQIYICYITMKQIQFCKS